MRPVAEVLMPEGGGPHPAVVLDAEAYGVNTFIRGIQQRLAGPADADNYDDFTEVKEHIARLDFTRGARDLAAAVLYFPSQPVFAELGPARPVHPVDLLWQLTCPALFLYGDQDKLMPARPHAPPGGGPGRVARRHHLSLRANGTVIT
jgi:carboxymethylenebutenolidase